MREGDGSGPVRAAATAFLFFAAGALAAPAGLEAQSEAGPDEEVTYAEDVAPILQESCVRCHRPAGVAPMSLTTYEDARQYAPLIKYRTGIRDRWGAMPPWYVEKDIGIQGYKDDYSLTDEQIATIARWADAGAPQGDPEKAPPPPEFDDTGGWTIDPDVVVRSEDISMGATAPDWWGEIESISIPLEEDRYVKAVEIREVNDVPSTGSGRQTVGSRWIVHHLIWRTVAPGESYREGQSWPVHELGRNPDYFDEDAGRLLKANSKIVSESAHLHSVGIDATGHLEFGFEFFPEDYEPRYERAQVRLGDGVDIDIRANEDGQELHAYAVLEQHTKIVAFEPHLHAPGERMCLEAIWGSHQETLSCVGYDHNWVRTYSFADSTQPLLPKGTVLHAIAWMNNSESNPNLPDPRNWQGSGNRSVANMFIDLGIHLRLTEEQFLEEMAKRREMLDLDANDYVIGCPLCMAAVPASPPKPVGAEEEAPAVSARSSEDDDSASADDAGARREDDDLDRRER